MLQIVTFQCCTSCFSKMDLQYDIRGHPMFVEPFEHYLLLKFLKFHIFFATSYRKKELVSIKFGSNFIMFWLYERYVSPICAIIECTIIALLKVDDVVIMIHDQGCSWVYSIVIYMRQIEVIYFKDKILAMQWLLKWISIGKITNDAMIS